MTNPYPGRVLDVLDGLGADARVLEVGSGARFVDGRVVSSDMVVTAGVDVASLAGALPFPDDVFDFVFSQAVLEHVPEPHLAVDEMVRVLKPGGVFHAEVAFMQPVHQAPHHYFNHTQYGLLLLCDGLTGVEFGPLGTFGDMVRWLCVDSGALEMLGLAWLDRVTEDLAVVHEQQTDDQRLRVASGVWLRGVKP